MPRPYPRIKPKGVFKGISTVLFVASLVVACVARTLGSVPQGDWDGFTEGFFFTTGSAFSALIWARLVKYYDAAFFVPPHALLLPASVFAISAVLGVLQPDIPFLPDIEVTVLSLAKEPELRADKRYPVSPGHTYLLAELRLEAVNGAYDVRYDGLDIALRANDSRYDAWLGQTNFSKPSRRVCSKPGIQTLPLNGIVTCWTAFEVPKGVHLGYINFNNGRVSDRTSEFSF